MKVAVLSDIHGNVIALESIKQSLEMESVDTLVFLGDLIMTGPRPREVYDLLEEMKPDVWIKGNTDDWLSELPEFKPSNDMERLLGEMGHWARDRITADIESELLKKAVSENHSLQQNHFNFCHGTPYSHSRAFLPDNSRDFLETELSGIKSEKIICGHTHMCFTMVYKNRIIKNFGAVSMPSGNTSHKARYGIININESVSFEERECAYDFKAYIEDLRQLKYPGNRLIFPKYGLSI